MPLLLSGDDFRHPHKKVMAEMRVVLGPWGHKQMIWVSSGAVGEDCLTMARVGSTRLSEVRKACDLSDTLVAVLYPAASFLLGITAHVSCLSLRHKTSHRKASGAYKSSSANQGKPRPCSCRTVGSRALVDGRNA